MTRFSIPDTGRITKIWVAHLGEVEIIPGTATQFTVGYDGGAVIEENLAVTTTGGDRLVIAPAHIVAVQLAPDIQDADVDRGERVDQPWATARFGRSSRE